MPQYTTVAQLKAAIPLTTAAFDTQLGEVISGISAVFDTIYGQSFVSQTLVELHDGSHSANGIVLLSKPDPLFSDWTSNSIVVEDGVTLVLGTDYDVSDPVTRRVLRLDGSGGQSTAGFAAGLRNVSITYNTTFLTIPDDLEVACRNESLVQWKRWNVSDTRDGGSAGVVSRGPEVGTSLSYTAEDLMPGTVRMLEAYKRRRDF